MDIQPQTFAAYIACCSECGREGANLTLNFDRMETTLSCGHKAHLVIKPNPLLGDEHV